MLGTYSAKCHVDFFVPVLGRMVVLVMSLNYICSQLSQYESLTMAILTVRNVPDEVHRALRVRAARHGRSTESEVREILASVVKPASRLRLGDALATLSREVGLTNEDFAVYEAVRDKAKDKIAAEPLRFE